MRCTDKSSIPVIVRRLELDNVTLVGKEGQMTSMIWIDRVWRTR